MKFCGHKGNKNLPKRIRQKELFIAQNEKRPSMRDASRSVSKRKREPSLEMHTQIYASMQGIALMGKALIGHLAVHEECMIVCVGQVAAPEIHLYLV